MEKPIAYLLVTQIPFTRNASGVPVVDQLWALDFEGRRIWGATAAILVWLGRWLQQEEGVLAGLTQA